MGGVDKSVTTDKDGADQTLTSGKDGVDQRLTLIRTEKTTG
jgi:hypothetical protein